MEIGETVTFTAKLQAKGKCIICSKKHKDRKKEQIKPVAPSNRGWHRKSMANVFESIPAKLRIYPNNNFKPPYKHQGHHCVALSALVEDANTKSPKDRIIRFNHFLNKVGFEPNREQNCIGLPARTGYGDFEAFWMALDKKKPLQMHGPGHDESYFMQVDGLLALLISMITNPDTCEQLEQDEWEDELEMMIGWLENYAFKKLASNDGVWRLHPADQKLAERIYFNPKSTKEKVPGKNIVYKGRGNPRRTITYPNPRLDTGPF
jgi:hypothetical protein